ncbi:hypothetical protein [Brachybacterium tyrofermentans]|uniref:hypothetical protein n=1 Tax=Brachybacterium tyrofermentans TaxID=47848 RepID=UPI003F9198DF
MGARRRDRSEGRALDLGWGADDDAALPPKASTATGASAAGAAGAADGPTGAAPGASRRGASRAPEVPGGKAGTRPRRAASRRRRVLAVGSALLLVLALTLGLPRLLSATTGPEQAATDFLQALVDGDLERVREHVEHAPDASGAALTSPILEAAGDRLESFTIDEVEVDGDTATVTVTLDNGSTTTTSRLPLAARDDGAFSPVRWELEPVQLPEFLLDVPLGVQEITVNGVRLPIADLNVEQNLYSPRVALQLLPGTYQVTLGDPGPWQEPVEVSLSAPPTLGTWRKPIEGAVPALSAEGRQEVQGQVDALPRDCPGTASTLSGDCPFALAGPEEPTADPSDPTGTWTLVDPIPVDSRGVDSFLWLLDGAGTAQFTPDDAASGAEDDAGDAPGLRSPVVLDAVAYVDFSGELRVQPSGQAGFSFAYCLDADTGAYIGIEMGSSTGAEGEAGASCETDLYGEVGAQ